MNTNRTALVTGASSGLGFETAAQLAEAGFDRIIVSARTDDLWKTRARDAGAIGYIEKPIDPMTFADQVEHILKGVG